MKIYYLIFCQKHGFLMVFVVENIENNQEMSFKFSNHFDMNGQEKT